MALEDTKQFKELLVKCTSTEGAAEVATTIEDMKPEVAKELLRVLLSDKANHECSFTPPARWAVLEQADPHGTLYSCNQRSRLCMGNFSDDEIANSVFLLGDSAHETPGSLSRAFSGIGVLTAAKERIRWLSRRVGFLEGEFIKLKPRMYTVRNGDTLYGIAKRETGDGEPWRELHENNRHIPNPDRIKAGDSYSFRF